MHSWRPINMLMIIFIAIIIKFWWLILILFVGSAWLVARHEVNQQAEVDRILNEIYNDASAEEKKKQ